MKHFLKEFLKELKNIIIFLCIFIPLSWFFSKAVINLLLWIVLS